ncbi:hypothetical protein [Shewanella colwelliana]|uniref:hypothetical protein n=1 Tax=Shewanella colwelliana TaxID=23 RepID=UPI0022B02214|nr:hypothetical protein [Shewanella colwelliana]MCZ4336729.1 hypothetical protein [Shewanella colwelliana]
MSQSSINPTLTAIATGQNSTVSSNLPIENLIPINIQFSTNKDTLVLNQQTLDVRYLQAADRSLIKLASEQPMATTLIQQQASLDQSISALLKTFGTATTIELPRSILAYIKGNQIDQSQLQQLAMRPQGYQLGEASIIGNKAIIGQSLHFIVPGDAISNGRYLATITLQNNTLALTLSPLLAQANVTLSPALGTDTYNSTHSKPSSMSALINKASLASTYISLNRELAKLSLSNSQFNALAQPLNKAEVASMSSHTIGLTQRSTLPVDALPGPVKAENLPSLASISQPSSTSFALQPALVNTPLFKLISQITGQLTQPLTNQSPLPQQTVNAMTQMVKGAETLGDSADNLVISPTANLKHTQSNANPVAKSTNGLTVNTEQSQGAPTTKPLHRGLKHLLNHIGPKALQTEQTTSQQSLLSLLKIAFPLAFPRPLTDLAATNMLKTELIDSFRGISTPGQINALTASHGGTIALLFQLLLGRQQSTPSSQALSAQLKQIQQQLGIRSTLLNMLDKAGATESLGKLISGLNLYQQASTDSTTNTQWYFTLPYMIDERQEEFEGHFEQDNQDHKKKDCWCLQLKFHLTLGAVLIKAEVKQQQVSLGFTSDSEQLLKAITNKSDALTQKLTQIGFEPKPITTQKSVLPASLLPGEHYLVKLKV